MRNQTVPQLLAKTIESNPDQTAYLRKVDGDWQKTTWREFGEMADLFAKSLVSLGVEVGDRIGILSETRLEWVICDSGILNCACVTVGIYPANRSPECAYVINHSDTRVLFVENNAQLVKIKEVRSELPTLEKIILFEGATNEAEGILSWKDFLALGDTVDFSSVQVRRDAIQPDDLASLVYTSGTTGLSKGAMISHRNLVFTSGSIRKSLKMEPCWTTLLFLPLAHVFARAIAMVCMHAGVSVAFAEDMEHVPDNMREIRPHFIASVPRVFEKFHARVLATMEAASPLKLALLKRAFCIGEQVSTKQQRGEQIPPMLRFRRNLYDKLVFRKIRNALGGRMEYAISGAAPLNRQIAEFHHACGILILEGIGMTENTSFSNVNQVDNNKFGTVGPAGEGIEVSIAEDGEVLFRGDNVMLGYFKDSRATREALDDDGWLHSGDIGVIDEDGFLKITDRKKDIIVTAGGKNVAPQRIERIMRTSPFIASIMAYGDKRKYVSALITLDPEAISEWAVQKGLGVIDLPELAGHPRVRELIRSEVTDRNEQMASYETVKKFHILGEDFSIENGELTATGKIKRRVVVERYWEELDTLYS